MTEDQEAYRGEVDAMQQRPASKSGLFCTRCEIRPVPRGQRMCPDCRVLVGARIKADKVAEADFDAARDAVVEAAVAWYEGDYRRAQSFDSETVYLSDQRLAAVAAFVRAYIEARDKP